MLVIEFKFHPELDLRGNLSSDAIGNDVAIPINAVKKHVRGEVFGVNETVCTLLFNEHDLAKSSPLNAKLLFNPIFLVGVIHGVALAAGLEEFVGHLCVRCNHYRVAIVYHDTTCTRVTTLV